MSLVRFFLVCLALSCSPVNADVQGQQECKIALALALDISASVDEAEYELQRTGLASALSAPDVRDLIIAERASLMVYEWSGARQQSVMTPWRKITSAAVLNAFVAEMLAHQRSEHEFPTAVGNAIAFGATMLAQEASCTRLVLDVSGDGSANAGFPPQSAYKHFPLSRVTVNALVIEGSDPDVRNYYLQNVIHGPGAFIEIASGFEDYETAMKRKLLRELQVRQFVSR